MTTGRHNAITVGMLLIVATVSAITGLLLYQPILTGQDYLVRGAGHKNQMILGALSESTRVCAAIGAAIIRTVS